MGVVKSCSFLALYHISSWEQAAGCWAPCVCVCVSVSSGIAHVVGSETYHRAFLTGTQNRLLYPVQFWSFSLTKMWTLSRIVDV